MKFRVIMLCPVGTGVVPAYIASDAYNAPFPVNRKSTALPFDNFDKAEAWQQKTLRTFGQTRHTEIVVSRD